jgi:hypothetical protein
MTEMLSLADIKDDSIGLRYTYESPEANWLLVGISFRFGWTASNSRQLRFISFTIKHQTRRNAGNAHDKP